MSTLFEEKSQAPSTRTSDDELLAKRTELLGGSYRLFYERPVHFVRGEGVWLYDADGLPYLDTYNNVASVGHCHPHVVAAIAQQAGRLNTHTRYLGEGIVDYADRLLATFPDHLSRLILTCTGSEANDLAVRIARSVTAREGFIVTELAYHGATVAVSEMSPSLGSLVDLGAHVRTVPAPVLPGSDPEAVGRIFADNVRAAMADLRRHGIQPAALLVDSIFSSDGIFPDPAGFLREAVDAVHDAGGLFIADEVQPGFARTGETMWGFQRHKVLPDMVSLGKPMGNGHPLAGLVLREDIAAAFGRQSRYFNTFGGNPVSCAAGMAVLEVIEAEGLLASVNDTGHYFRKCLREATASLPFITDVRGVGLFIGVETGATDELSPAEVTARIVNGLRDRRVLVSMTGTYSNVLKVRPPLVFSKANVDQFMEVFGEVLETLS